MELLLPTLLAAFILSGIVALVYKCKFYRKVKWHTENNRWVKRQTFLAWIISFIVLTILIYGTMALFYTIFK